MIPGSGKLLRSVRLNWRKDDDEIKVEEILPKLIQEQQWNALRSLLLSSRMRDQLEQYFSEISQEPMLIFASRFHLPLEVIVVLFAMQREVINYSDRLGRGPLHYACKHGASPKVVEFLLDKEPLLASKQDVRGRTPLHFACQYYIRSYSRQPETKTLSSGEAIITVVCDICRAVPTLVNLDDEEGRSALEYAIEGEFPIKVVKTLQRLSQDCWKGNDALIKSQEAYALTQNHVSWNIKESIESSDRATRLLFTERCQTLKKRAAKST